MFPLLLFTWIFYAEPVGVVQDCICIAFNAQPKVYEIESL